jgi:hypothetical protein
MSAPLNIGDAIALQCQGNIPGPLWLDGRTRDGTVGLAPQTGGGFTGTRWRVHDAGQGSYTVYLECLGDVEGPRYLDGRDDGTVFLAAQPGAFWQVYVNVVNGDGLWFEIRRFSGSSLRWLDGRTGDGTVGLAPETAGGFSGTLWKAFFLAEDRPRPG